MTSRNTKITLIALLTLAMTMFGCRSLRDRLSGNDTSTGTTAGASMASSAPQQNSTTDVKGTPPNAGSNSGSTGTGNSTNNTNNNMNTPYTTGSSTLNTTNTTPSTDNTAGISSSTTTTTTETTTDTTAGNEGGHPTHRHRAMHKE